jgi:TonB-linked SusC/RagA family outer membrane protein
VGTVTDIDGNYTITVPSSDAVLVYSFIGSLNQEVAVGNRNSIDIALAEDVKELNEVVVTALGIEREKRSLGYSIQEVKGEELTQAREANVVNSLSGKVAGVQIINTSGGVGASSRILIRGANSIKGESQPLFVINGIPIDNSTNRNDGYGGVDWGNAAADINPNDIESISVLKGPNAAALYGARGANGVILITTKSARAGKGLNVTYDHNLTFEKPLRLPDWQDEYGQGYPDRNGVPQFSFVDGAGGGLMDGVDESWGPRFDGQPRSQFFGTGPWVAKPNNVRDFFETGRTMTNSVALSGGNEFANARLSLTNMDQKGILPNTDLKRNIINLASGMKMGNRLTVNSNITYTQNASNNRPGNGYGGDNVMQQFIWFGRQVDINQLRNYENEDGTQYNWNYNYHNNPYWILHKNTNASSRDRINGMVSARYNFTDWLSLQTRIGTDMYSENRKRVFAKNTVEYPDGRFTEADILQREINADFLLTATKQITQDISLTGTFGGNHMTNNYRYNGVTVQALVLPNLYSTNNAEGNPVVAQQARRFEINSFYGTANFNFRNYLSVDGTMRRDWASTLEQPFNYGSVATSFVFSDAFNIPANVMSFGKIRGSWAKAGNYADAHLNRAVYNAQVPFDGMANFTLSDRIPPSNLRNEDTYSAEFGADLKFFNNRLGLDVTYYNSTTVNQIFNVPVSSTSGGTSRVVNAGSIQNRGIELMLNAEPVRLTNGFRWDVMVNFARNRSEVVSLIDELQTVQLGRYWGLDLETRVGQPYGTLFGSGYLRDPESGKIVVNAAGIPMRDPQQKVLGNILPDWVGGIRNGFTYKNFNANFLIDVRKGGDIFSVTHMFGRYGGVTKETLEGREGGLVVPNAVKVGSDGSYVANDINVSAIRYNQGLYGTHEAHIFDGSFVKLREVVIGFNLPKSLVNRTFLSGANLSLVGRNLLLLHSNIPHIDPETAFGGDASTQGFEFGALPSTRSVGFNLRLTL